VHDGPNEYLTGPYTEAEFWDDLWTATGGNTNERLARLTLRESAEVGAWMERNGCRFQAPLRGTLQLSRTNAFFLGGGKALLNAYYDTAIGLGVKVAYEAEVAELTMGNGIFASATVLTNGEPQQIRAKAAVVASGGFQANLDWLRESWGPAVDNFIVRGTPFATGRMLRVLLDHGVTPVGDPSQCHAVAVDARAPKFDGGIVTRLDCIPFGIVVDKNGRRFSDEGEDFWPKRYAIWGLLVAKLPDQLAYSIFDSKATGRFMPSVFPAIEAGSVSELAVELSLDQRALQETVDRFNASVRQGVFDPDVLDDCSTQGLDPPKSHWALPLDTPPFYAYPLRPGITFTYLGVTVNDRAQVVMEGGRPIPNVFAAGEIMAGNILGQGYLAGLGMTIGTVFGRIAGEAAARYALTH
jgi:tricarballylate dehydrogenase